MLGEEDDAERALTQLADDLVLGQSVLLGEALCTQYLTVPVVQGCCVTEVHRSLLRRRALEEQAVAGVGGVRRRRAPGH